MSPDEIRWRAAVAVRTAGQRIAAKIRAPRWNRADLRRILAPDILDRDLKTQISAADWSAVHEALASRILARPARFVLAPAAAPQLRALIEARWPAAATEARARADRLLSKQYDLLGYRGLQFADARGETDWHLDPVHNRRAPRLFYGDVPYLDPTVGDHKVIWEMNRHQHWLSLGRAAWLTGDPRYARAITGDLGSWLAANPPLTGINWASMLEVGFRSMSWTWAMHCLLEQRVRFAEPAPHCKPAVCAGCGGEADDPAAQPWLVDMFVGLDRQLTHVEHNLSCYFSPNTHLTGEALALYVVGTALPELAASARWRATGRRILLDEIDRQINADGGHAERSTHYQRYTLDFYLLALLTARIAGDAEAAARFEDAATRLAEFTQVMADDDGRLPLIGDDDGGMLWPLSGRACHDVRDSLSVAAVVLDRPDLAPWGMPEETAWIAGPELAGTPGAVPLPRAPHETARTVGSRALSGTGYFVARGDGGAHAVFDAGAHGYMNGGHAHADALSLTLSLDGKPLLIDPGTSTYTVNPVLRDRFRSSMSHNTVTVDGRPQSVPSGPFHWRTRTDARMQEWRQNPAFDWVEASHDGYAPLRHRRTMMRTDGGWIVADEILGEGPHTAAAHWHFDPAWTVAREAGRLRATHQDGSIVWLAHDSGDAALYHGDEATGLGWFAPVYGTLVPSPSARISVEGEAPLALITWIGSDRDFNAPVLQRIDAQCNATSAAIAGQITARDGEAVFLFRPGGPATHAARGCRIVDFETDARVVHYRSSGDRLDSLDVVDARYVTTPRPNWMSFEADAAIRDLHVGVEDGTLDLRASIPPGRLQVRGMRLHTVRLNGRELPLSTGATTGLLLIHGGDWRDSAPKSAADSALARSGAGFAQH